jgi:hypothetical protein
MTRYPTMNDCCFCFPIQTFCIDYTTAAAVLAPPPKTRQMMTKHLKSIAIFGGVTGARWNEICAYVTTNWSKIKVKNPFDLTRGATTK